MKIAVCGISGFVGNALKEHFQSNGDTVVSISVRPSTSVESIIEKLEGCDVLINLAGTSILGRWNSSYKEELRRSRINTTQKLVDAMARTSKPPSVLLNASAIGIYDNEHQHDETSYHHADDFLASLVHEWENTAFSAQTEITRVCVMRFGVVYGAGGGAMAKMLPPFRIGLGGKMGDGFQMVSWIHLYDLVRACAFLIHHNEIHGIVNFTSPEPISNYMQTRIMARILRRPAFFDLPAWLVKVAFGEGSTVMLDSKEVYPKVLQDAGFEFLHPTFDSALAQIVRGQG